jgi:hypothetical protein
MRMLCMGAPNRLRGGPLQPNRILCAHKRCHAVMWCCAVLCCAVLCASVLPDHDAICQRSTSGATGIQPVPVTITQQQRCQWTEELHWHLPGLGTRPAPYLEPWASGRQRASALTGDSASSSLTIFRDRATVAGVWRFRGDAQELGKDFVRRYCRDALRMKLGQPMAASTTTSTVPAAETGDADAGGAENAAPQRAATAEPPAGQPLSRKPSSQVSIDGNWP